MIHPTSWTQDHENLQEFWAMKTTTLGSLFMNVFATRPVVWGTKVEEASSKSYGSHKYYLIIMDEALEFLNI